MGLQSDAIESRLEGLKVHDRRMMYDSKLRAFRRETESRPAAGNFAAMEIGDVEPARPLDQVVLLLEELSNRIDGLEKKNRTLGDEIRRRNRADRRRRSTTLAGVLAASVLLGLGRILQWF